MAILRILNFSMELNTVEFTIIVIHGTDWAVDAGCGSPEAFWYAGHEVAVAHPDGLIFWQIAEKLGAVIGDFNVRFAVFTVVSRFNIPTEPLCHQLHAITDTQNRNAELEKILINT